MAPPLLPLLLLSLTALEGHAIALLQEGRTLELLDVMRQPPIRDSGAVHFATVACRNCFPLLALVRSAAAQARLEGGKKPFLHLFTDYMCAKSVNKLSASEPGILDSMDVRMYDTASLPNLATQKMPHGKTCTMVRLVLPRLFPLLQRLIYLDEDTIVLNSFRPLWQMPVPVVAMADDNRNWHASGFSNCPTWRNGSKALLQGSAPGTGRKCWAGDHGLNAGVMLFNLTGWRAHNFDREVDWWADLVYRGEVDVPMNDQDIINMILAPHEEYAAELPCEANLRTTHMWMCLFSDGSWESWDNRGAAVLRRDKRRPIVLHSRFGQGVIAQQWSYLFNRTMTLARLVNAEGLRNGSSLCDVVDCQRLVLQETHACDRCQPSWAPQKPCVCSILRDFVEDQTYPHTD
mmetsp:Transcript_56178/g.164124  ORF Transcript_56178/g.164124 Transcript_56178/m.164124 type:complete len:404 (+) Transcript_56178:58-1269(+)